MTKEKDTLLTVVPDALLLQRFHEGDIISFETLYKRHYDRVYGILFRLTGTRGEAEDLAQEVFLKLYRTRLKRDSNLAGWLYRVAVNMGYNALRASQRRSQREAASSPDVYVRETPETAAVVHETRDEVRAALAKIPTRSAKLLLLREMGFSYGEMAEIVNVAPGSVGTLLSRARKAFEKAYQAGQQEGGRDANS